MGDRSNNRIQIFDQDGKFLAEWRQFGRPTAIYIDASDTVYVADHRSEGIAVDANGNIYGAEVALKSVVKYVRKQ